MLTYYFGINFGGVFIGETKSKRKIKIRTENNVSCALRISDPGLFLPRLPTVRFFFLPLSALEAQM